MADSIEMEQNTGRALKRCIIFVIVVLQAAWCLLSSRQRPVIFDTKGVASCDLALSSAAKNVLPSSYATMIDSEHLAVGIVFLWSLAMVHPNATVYIALSRQSRRRLLQCTPRLPTYLRMHWIFDEHMKLLAEEKTRVIEVALRDADDTLYVDSETILLEPIRIPVDTYGMQSRARLHCHGCMTWVNEQGLSRAWFRKVRSFERCPCGVFGDDAIYEMGRFGKHLYLDIRGALTYNNCNVKSMHANFTALAFTMNVDVLLSASPKESHIRVSRLLAWARCGFHLPHLDFQPKPIDVDNRSKPYPPLRRRCDRPHIPHARLDYGIVVIADNPFVMLPVLPEARADEFKHVLRLNLASRYVAQVHLLNQAPHNGTRYMRPTRGGKLRVYDVGGLRSTFLDAVRYANAALPPGTIIAIANADIAFSHPSVLLATRLADPNALLALTRYEVDIEQKTAKLFAKPAWSQDAWIMRTPVTEHPDMDFPLGALGSDNKLAYVFASKLRKRVYNWCEDIVLLHFHASQVRSDKPRLPSPYKPLPPTRANLSALELSWRMDAVQMSGPNMLPVARWPLPTVNVISPELKPSLVWSYVAPRDQRRLPLRLHADHMVMTPIQGKQLRQATPPKISGAVGDMYLALKARQPKGLDSNSAAQERWQYLDLPWEVMARTRTPLQDGRLLERMICELQPRVENLNRVFALLPRDAVSAVCKGASEWSRGLKLGAVSRDGDFEGIIVCP
jgi:hypothetical protein